MAARKKAKHYPGAISVVYLPANQAWAVMWHDQVLSVFNRKAEAEGRASELTYGAKTEAELDAITQERRTKAEAISRQKYPYENPWVAVGAGAGLNKPRRKKKAARNPMYAPEKVRTVKLSPYRKGAGPTFTLELWDLNQSDPEGRFAVGYKLIENSGTQGGTAHNHKRTIFECKEFACSVRMREAVDSDEAVASVLSWLTLRPGDTDADWFANYTPGQMDFANAHAEALAMESINRFGER